MTGNTWAVNALGPVPADPAARRAWQTEAASIAAYRETYGYDHPDDPIGREPSLDWAGLGDILPSWWAPHPDAIFQPPKPEITPSAKILQLAAEQDIELEVGG